MYSHKNKSQTLESMNSKKRFVWAVFALLVCGPSIAWPETGLHIYDASRFQAAQEIRNALTNIQLDRVVINVRSNLTLLSSKEQALVAEEVRLVRDTSIYAVLTTKQPLGNYFGTNLIEGRLKQILNDLESLDQVANDIKAAEMRQREAGELTGRFRRVTGKEPPAFVPPQDYPALDPLYTNGLTGNALIEAELDYENLRKKYQQINKLFTTYASKGGALGDALTALSDEFAEAKTLQEEETQAETNLAAATKRYEDAVKTNQKPEEIAKKAQGLIQKIRDTIEKGGAGAKKVGLQTQYDAVMALLNAVASGTAAKNQYSVTSPELGTAVQIAAHLPGLAEAAAKVRGYSVSIPVSGLILNKQMLALEIEGAKNDLAFHGEIRACLIRQVDALILETEYLLRARSALQTNNTWWENTKSMPELLSDTGLSPDKREKIFTALVNYAASIEIGQQAYYQEDARRVQLNYEGAVLHSEKALKQWQALVQAPVIQILNYYSTGFKADQVADTVVKALGLAAIAWRL
jgi:hypothetical protein